MLDTGAWGLPVLFDGTTDLQKPPGYYWLVAAVGWLRGGVDAWAARLPAALAGLLTVALVYGFLRREGRPTAALVAALALATATHFTAISRTARIDVPLTLAVTASLLAFRRGCVGDRRLLWHAVSGGAAAAGVMLKGPVALALIGPAAVAWLSVERLQASRRPSGRGCDSDTGLETGATREGTRSLTLAVRPILPPSSIALGVAVLAVLALPWFLWADAATGGEFFRVFFWHHNVARFAGTSPTLASYPWWYYAPRLAVDFLPWTPAVVLLAGWAVRTRRLRDDPPARFAVVWISVMFAILSASKFKRADYLLPLFPGAAILLGCCAERWLATRTSPRTVTGAKWAFGVTLALVAVGWQVMAFAVEPAEQAREEKRAFAAAVRAHAPAPQTVLMFCVESHLLAFHLGHPLYTTTDLKELNDRLAEPGPHVVVAPPEYAYLAQQVIRCRRLVEVDRLADHTPARPPRPLVLLVTAD